MTSSGMADLAHVASARGATYADARTVEREHEAVSVKDGAVESVTRSADRGLAFRVIHRGAWGFAATDRTDASSLGELIDEAFRRAEAAASARRKASSTRPRIAASSARSVAANPQAPLWTMRKPTPRSADRVTDSTAPSLTLTDSCSRSTARASA